MKYVYTLHAEEKLTVPEIKKLKIDKNKIEKVVEHPITTDNSDKPVLIAIGKLTKTLSLQVVYKFVEEKIRIITFFPAEKRRYENKILQKR